MFEQDLYIARKQTNDFETALGAALSQPSQYPLMFHIYGVGGVGKSTLLTRIQVTLQEKAAITGLSFEGSETPISVMEHLFRQLPVLGRWEGGFSKDPFPTTLERYQQTLHELGTQPIEGNTSVDKGQIELVKKLARFGTSTATRLLVPDPILTPEIAAGAAEMAVDAVALVLTEKDRLLQLLQQHKSTRKQKALQELLLEPVSRLTHAFIESLSRRAKRKPIVLILDTFEKSTPEICLWLCKYFLRDAGLRACKFRFVMAGRHCLRKTDAWQRHRLARDVLHEVALETFSRAQTEQYLQQIGIVNLIEIDRIYQQTRGLPYYLNWLRREKVDGRPVNFSVGNREIVERLTQGMSPAKIRVLQVIACTRRFDRALIDALTKVLICGEDDGSSEMSSPFDWLQQQDFVQLMESDYYRLDDVARDVFRRALWQDSRELFQQTHALLAGYYQTQANAAVPTNASVFARYRNPDWLDLTAEVIYHTLFSGSQDAEVMLVSHLFESRYLGDHEVVIRPISAVKAEAPFDTHPLLTKSMRSILSSIAVALENATDLLNIHASAAAFGARRAAGELSSAQLQAAANVCFRRIDDLRGFARVAGQFYKVRYCRHQERVMLLHQARAQIDVLAAEPAGQEPDWIAHLFLNLGDLFSEFSAVEDAVASYDRALQFSPAHPFALNNRGMCLQTLGRLEDALTSHDKAQEILPGFPPLMVNRASVLEALNRSDEALAIYVGLNETHSEFWLAWMVRGRMLLQRRGFEEALQVYDSALALAPENSFTWMRRGDALSALHRWGDALASYARASFNNPMDALVLCRRANVLVNLKRASEALVCLAEATSLQPRNLAVLCAQAAALRALGRLSEALAILRRATSLLPDSADSWYALGYFQMSLQQHADALASFDVALSLIPNHLDARHQRSMMSALLGQHQEALTGLEMVTEQCPSHANAWMNRGVALAYLGRFVEAIDCYQKALALDDRDAGTYQNMALALAHLQRYEEALENLSLTTEIVPERWEAWRIRGQILALMGRSQEASVALSQAAKLNPEDISLQREYEIARAGADLARENLEHAVADATVATVPDRTT